MRVDTDIHRIRHFEYGYIICMNNRRATGLYETKNKQGKAHISSNISNNVYGHSLKIRAFSIDPAPASMALIQPQTPEEQKHELMTSF